MTHVLQIISVFFGASLAFIFNFIIRSYLIRSSQRKDTSTSLKLMSVLARDLSLVIDLDPEIYTHVKVDPYQFRLSSVLGIEDALNGYEEMNRIYIHWRNGNYYREGHKFQDIEEDREALVNISQNLDTLSHIAHDHVNRIISLNKPKWLR